MAGTGMTVMLSDIHNFRNLCNAFTNLNPLHFSNEGYK